MMKFSITKCQALPLGPSNQYHKYGLGEIGSRVTHTKQQQPRLGFFFGPQHLMSQLLNKQAVTGASSLRQRLDKVDQKASDDPSEDSKLHPLLSHPFSLCLSTIRLWHRAQQPQGQVLL